MVWRERSHHFFVGDAAFQHVAAEPQHKDAGGMKKCLSLFDLILLGVAAVVGAGVFVVTGVTARDVAGPAVIISYLLAGIACIITALCYAEFSTETTVTGGSVVYTARTFGKFVAWIVAINVLMEYIIAVAAVGKGFSPYFCTMIGAEPTAALLITKGAGGAPLEIDLVAFGIIILISALLAYGMREAAWVNTVVTVVVIAVVCFTFITGLVHVNPANFKPFLPYSFNGVFSAAASVFFAFIGFDMVATAAEEARNPLRDIPLASVASVVITGAMYVLMATAIVGMVTYTQIDTGAPFAVAFTQLGKPWAATIVSVGAVLSITDTLLVVIYGMSRTFVVLGRFHLIPQAMGRVHPKTQTPLLATCVCALISATLSAFVPIDALVDLVALGTLVAFGVVCLAVLWRRYYQPSCGRNRVPLLIPLIMVLGGSVALGCSYQQSTHWGVWVAMGVVWLAGTIWFACMKRIYTPTGFQTPLFPLWPCLGVLVTMFLVGTLGPAAWERWAYILAAGMVFYTLFNLYEQRYGSGNRLAPDVEAGKLPALGDASSDARMEAVDNPATGPKGVVPGVVSALNQ